jgi:hypothetical protein
VSRSAHLSFMFASAWGDVSLSCQHFGLTQTINHNIMDGPSTWKAHVHGVMQR